jgi:hypothetical protein
MFFYNIYTPLFLIWWKYRTKAGIHKGLLIWKFAPKSARLTDQVREVLRYILL